jgi:hypothetical protein
MFRFIFSLYMVQSKYNTSSRLLDHTISAQPNPHALWP